MTRMEAVVQGAQQLCWTLQHVGSTNLWELLLSAGPWLIANQVLFGTRCLIDGWFKGQLLFAGQSLGKAHLPQPWQNPPCCGG